MSEGDVAPGAATAEQLELLLRGIQDYAIAMLDPNGVVRSWNEGGARLSGYAADEMIGRHISLLYPEEDVRAGKCEDALATAARLGRFEDLGWRVRRDGARYLARVVITALRDEGEALIGFGEVAQDVTARQAAEDALREREERFRLLVEGVRDYAIFMLDPEGRVLSWNEGAAALKGYTRDEILGRHFSAFYPEEDVRAGKCERALAEARRAGRFEDLGWRVRKDGGRFFANVVITALFEPGGRLRGFAKITRDITDRRRAEDELRASEERFRLLVEGVQDYAIYMLDPEGRIVLWNAGAERIKGYGAAEVVGRHVSLFYTPEDLAAGQVERELARAARDGRFEDEGWRVRRDGTRFWANVVLTSLRDEAGELLGFAKVTRDLTARRQAEEDRLQLVREQAARQAAEEQARERAELAAQLVDANARLTEAVRARDDFLTIASHELKTPLYTLAMLVTTGQWLASQGAARDRLVARFASAENEVKRLDRLVDSLLDVSRITAGRLRLELEQVDLVALCRAVLERDREEIARAGSSVDLRASEPALTGTWDRLRLDQVVTNLLSNALKYGQRQPVTIQVDRAGDRARLTVEDRGAGIEAADQARIFERFERAVPSRNVSGFGLGLWIVRQIVEAMGGTIAVRSAPGEGARFTVELPLQTEPPPPETRA